MSPEIKATRIKTSHGLSSLHIFDAADGWRVFGFRVHAKGYQASVESGTGSTIEEALRNLDARLIEGPIHRVPEPPTEAA